MVSLGIRVRCAICNDDYAFLRSFERRLENYFAGHLNNYECHFFLTPSELLLASIDSFDIVFLNVDTGYWDGINIAKSIRRAGIDTLIIFVSDYIQFAPQGYRVEAFRFLMKDELDETFPEAMDNALERLGMPDRSLAVRCNKEEIDIPVKHIKYASSDKRVLTYHMLGYTCDSLSAYGKLSDLEERLGARGFLRVHKSFLVNLRHVEGIRNYVVYFTDGTTLQTSRRNYREIIEHYERWKAKNMI